VVGFINKELVVDANTTVSQDSQHVYHTRNFGEKEKYSFKQIVSEEVEKDKIEAKYENNILTVKLYFVTPPVIDIK
jgi:HSP20 family molecular chaperone IbpA